MTKRTATLGEASIAYSKGAVNPLHITPSASIGTRCDFGGKRGRYRCSGRFVIDGIAVPGGGGEDGGGNRILLVSPFVLLLAGL